MAKILSTKACAATLEHIIRKCEKELYMFSFSYIVGDSFITRLRQASDKGIVINLVYGVPIKAEILEKLKKIKNLNIYHYPNLHAKIFANETHCMIGSMNFSEASEINNTELGVLLTSTGVDEKPFKDAIEHCKDLLQDAVKQFPIDKNQFHSLPKTNISKKTSLIERSEIKKSSEKKFEYISVFEYHRKENFFYPSLKELLLLNYPNIDVELDKTGLRINDFANKNVSVEITARMDILFDDSDEFKDFTDNCDSFLHNKLKFFRIYWNKDQINLYLPKGYERRIDQSQLKFMVDRHFEALKIIHDILCEI